MRRALGGTALAAALLMVLAGAAGASPGVSQQSFGSCADARAAGYSDIAIGAPGYSAELDRDNDGVACDEGDVATTTVVPAPEAIAQPAPTAEVLGAQETAADQPGELASTGSSSWVLTAVAAALVLGGIQLVRAGYERLDWIAGRRYSEVRYTVEPDNTGDDRRTHRRSRRR